MNAARRDFLTLAGLAAASICSGCANGGGKTEAWTKRDLENLTTNAGRNGARGWAAWQGRRQVAEFRPTERAPSLSITKSLAALAATRAADNGWLSPYEKVSETITEWRGDPWKSQITVLMLLQQVSGLEAGVIPLYRNHPVDKGKAAASLKCIDSPGSVFRYGPGHWEVLAELMKRKLSSKGQSLSTFMARAVMSPVGLNAGNWRSDRSDTPYFSTGTELSVQELGRLGRTIASLLRNRNSDGFSAEHFASMTRPSSANPMFGGGLWRNTNARRAGAGVIEVERSIDNPLPASYWSRACLSTRQPSDLVVLIGSGGKRVYLWPEQDRRVARIGSSGSWSDAAFLSGLGAG